MAPDADDALLAQLRRGTLQFYVLALLAGEPRYAFDVVRDLSEVEGMDGRRRGGNGALHPSIAHVQRRRRSPAGREGRTMMTSPTSAADAATADYLDDLHDLLAPLPRDRRRELVRDLEIHIGTARAELADPFSEAEVRNLLDRLGTPQEIAEAEGIEPAPITPPVAPQASWRQPAAIVLLLFGGFIGGIGWLVGLVLLWASPRWRTIDKLVGSVVLPGGLATSASRS